MFIGIHNSDSFFGLDLYRNDLFLKFSLVDGLTCALVTHKGQLVALFPGDTLLQ